MYSFLLICIFVFFLLAILTVESRTNRENNVYTSLKRATDDAIESVLEEQAYTVRSNEQFVASLSEMLCNSIISQSETMTCTCGYKSNRPEEYILKTDDSNAAFSDYRYLYQCPNCHTTQIANPNGQTAAERTGISFDTTTVDPNLKLVIEVIDADYRKGLLSLNIIQEYTNPNGEIGTCEYSTTVLFDEVKIHDTYVIHYYEANGILIQSYLVRAGDPWPEPSEEMKQKYCITQWGSSVGGGGTLFVIPQNVPMDNKDNPLAQYPHYDVVTNSIHLYGDYQQP